MKAKGPEPASDPLDEVLRAVSSVRHGVNNALMGIFGHIEILLSDPDVPEPVRRRVEKIRLEAERLRERVAELSAIRKT